MSIYPSLLLAFSVKLLSVLFVSSLVASAATSVKAESATKITAPTVVSINLCADQLVLLLAEPKQILSLSNLSHEKAGSYLFEQARKFPTNTGASEEVLRLTPDFVIAGEYTTINTVKLVRELGTRVEIIPIANTLEQMYTNIENVAQWLGRQTQGALLVTELRARVAELQMRYKQDQDDRPTAAYYDANGYTVGSETLRGQILQLSGWRNVAAEGGITHYGTLSLESVIQLAPDALIDSPYSVDTYSRGQNVLAHPALRASGLDPLVINIPSRQTICAGPWTVDMLEILSKERDNYSSAR